MNSITGLILRFKANHFVGCPREEKCIDLRRSMKTATVFFPINVQLPLIRRNECTNVYTRGNRLISTDIMSVCSKIFPQTSDHHQNLPDSWSRYFNEVELKTHKLTTIVSVNSKRFERKKMWPIYVHSTIWRSNEQWMKFCVHAFGKIRMSEYQVFRS